MKPAPEIRAATAQDLRAFYGEAPTVDVRAYVAVLDGQVIGVGGTFDHEGRPIGFCDMRPELRRHPRTIVAGIRLFLRECGRETLVVRADPLPTAPGFLAHLGFTPYETPEGNAFVRYA